MGWIFIAVLALLLVGFIAAGFAFGHPYMMYGPGQYYYGMPYFFPFGFIFFFIVVFFIFRLLFWGSWGWGYRGHRRYWGDPKEVLKHRYARGEITKEQFDQMMRDLEQHA